MDKALSRTQGRINDLSLSKSQIREKSLTKLDASPDVVVHSKVPTDFWKDPERSKRLNIVPRDLLEINFSFNRIKSLLHDVKTSKPYNPNLKTRTLTTYQA